MRLPGPIWRLFTTSPTNHKPERVTKNPISISSIKQLHAHLIRTHLHTNPYSISPVLKAYALSSAHLPEAHCVFNQIEKPTLLIFNYLIRGLSQSNQPKDAIFMYNNLMYCKGIIGDNLSFIYLFKACARANDFVHGQLFHGFVFKLGFERCYLFVSNALINMYASFGHLGFARKVFDEMGERDLVTWNSLICAFAQWNKFEKVLGLFDLMQEANVKADAVTMVKVLLACGRLRDRGAEEAMVKYIEDNEVDIDVYLGNTLIDMYGHRGSVDLAWEVFDGMQERNVVSWNAMIKGYIKVGNVVAARELFDSMPQRDVISWTTMINGFVQANQFSDAVKVFQEMMKAEVKADEVTVASVLSACARLSSLNVGKAVHKYIRGHGIREDVYVRNALVDMYFKCGEVEKALEVFNGMKEKDYVSWNSVISGLAVNGFAHAALELFSQMLRHGVQPTHGSFAGALLACTHSGLVDKGLEYFEIMEKVYRLKPEMKHYGLIVDLLGRFGKLNRAYDFIKAMPVVPSDVIWRILLSACKLHGNLILAEIASNKLLELYPSNGGDYVLLSNAYAGSDRWDDASKMRELMGESDLLKPSGWSSIEARPTMNNS